MLVPITTGQSTYVGLPKLGLPFRIRITDLGMLKEQIRKYGDVGQVNLSIYCDRNGSLLYLFTFIIRGDSTYDFRLSFDPNATPPGEPWIRVPSITTVTLMSVSEASITRGSYVAIDFLSNRVEAYFNTSRMITFTHDLSNIRASMLGAYGIYLRAGTVVTGSPLLINVDVEQLFDASVLASAIIPVAIAIGVVSSIVALITKIKI